MRVLPKELEQTPADQAFDEYIDAAAEYTYAEEWEISHGSAYDKLHKAQLKARKLRQEELKEARKLSDDR